MRSNRSNWSLVVQGSPFEYLDPKTFGLHPSSLSMKLAIQALAFMPLDSSLHLEDGWSTAFRWDFLMWSNWDLAPQQVSKLFTLTIYLVLPKTFTSFGTNTWKVYYTYIIYFKHVLPTKACKTWSMSCTYTSIWDTWVMLIHIWVWKPKYF